MTSYEPIQAGPYLLPSDPPDIANITKAIVDWSAIRIKGRYATTAARDAARPTPVEGEECFTGTGITLVSWLYRSAAWVAIPQAPAATIVNLTNGDHSSVVTIATTTFTAVVGRTYRISAGIIATQVSTSGTPTVKLLMDAVEVFRMASSVAFAPSEVLWGTPAVYYLAGDGSSHTFTVTAQTTASALRVAASGINRLVVEQVG